MTARSAPAFLGVLAALMGAGCGDDSSASSSSSGDSELVISAASSLEPAFTAYAESAGIDAKQSFAGSDDLAAQIRQGVKPDVYAAANTALPQELNMEGLLGPPVEFATNELVLAVPSDSEIRNLSQLAREDLKIAIGSESVPIGSYTRELLDRLSKTTG